MTSGKEKDRAGLNVPAFRPAAARLIEALQSASSLPPGLVASVDPEPIDSPAEIDRMALRLALFSSTTADPSPAIDARVDDTVTPAELSELKTAMEQGWIFAYAKTVSFSEREVVLRTVAQTRCKQLRQKRI